jgi:hypothetical protein
MTAEDFVDVKLSAAGEALAGATPALAPGETFAGESSAPCLRIAGGNYEYCFEPGKIQRLTGAEFRSRLEQTVIQGQAMFEIVAPAKQSKTRPIVNSTDGAAIERS